MKLQGGIRLIIVVTALIIMLPGCAINKATSTVDPTTDLSSLKVFYVEKYSEDTRDTNIVIEKKLDEMGFTVSEDNSGVDAVVTYKDKWFWDITFYLLELTITLRDPESNFPLASANSIHTSLTRKSQEGMVDEVLTNIFFKDQKEGATNEN